MLKNKQSINWTLDAVLLAMFILEFFLQLTGIDMHQWLGIGMGLLVLVHLVLHWKWVQGVLRNFSTRCSSQARWYAFLDLLLIMGFVLIGFSGLLVATWFTLNIDYMLVIDIHVAIAFSTLAILLIKIAVHYKWIISATKKMWSTTSQRSTSDTQIAAPPMPCSETLQKLDSTHISRRRFIGFMGLITAASAVSLYNVTARPAQASGRVTQLFPDSQARQPELSTPTSAVQPASTQSIGQNSVTAGPTQTSLPTAASTQVASCTYNCRKGLHCAYPGRCRDYMDLNANGLCDNGECL